MATFIEQQERLSGGREVLILFHKVMSMCRTHLHLLFKFLSFLLWLRRARLYYLHCLVALMRHYGAVCGHQEAHLDVGVLESWQIVIARSYWRWRIQILLEIMQGTVGCLARVILIIVEMFSFNLHIFIYRLKWTKLLTLLLSAILRHSNPISMSFKHWIQQ